MGWGEWNGGNKEISDLPEISKTNNGFQFHLTKFIEDIRSYAESQLLVFQFLNKYYTQQHHVRNSQAILYDMQAYNVNWQSDGSLNLLILSTCKFHIYNAITHRGLRKSSTDS